MVDIRVFDFLFFASMGARGGRLWPLSSSFLVLAAVKGVSFLTTCSLAWLEHTKNTEGQHHFDRVQLVTISPYKTASSFRAADLMVCFNCLIRFNDEQNTRRVQDHPEKRIAHAVSLYLMKANPYVLFVSFLGPTRPALDLLA